MKKVFLSILILCITGCSNVHNKLSTENYQKLKKGLTYDEVVSIIGRPRFIGFDADQEDLCRNTSDTCSWSKCDICEPEIYLTFNNGVLVDKKKY